MIVSALMAAILAGAMPQEAECRLPDGKTPAEARTAAWYINNDPIGYGPRRYIKYGPPRVIAMEELQVIGAYQGVPVLVPKADKVAGVIYVFADLSDCSFQPYQLEQR